MREMTLDQALAMWNGMGDHYGRAVRDAKIAIRLQQNQDRQAELCAAGAFGNRLTAEEQKELGTLLAQEIKLRGMYS